MNALSWLMTVAWGLACGLLGWCIREYVYERTEERLLSCGCLNGGVVYSHLYCDWTARARHRDLPHDCGPRQVVSDSRRASMLRKVDFDIGPEKP